MGIKHKVSILRKSITFILIGILITIKLGKVFQPIWTDWSNYDRTEAFYDRPSNTISVIFVGSSCVTNGFIPMQLYNDHGFAAYNLGSEQQPMLASYYWIEEAFRLHKESLQVVVLDVSMLKRSAQEAFYKKAIDGMRVSHVKIRALMDMTDSVDDFQRYMNPISEYHNRWETLTRNDFEKKDIIAYKQGYNYTLTSCIDEDYDVFPDMYFDENVEETTFNSNSLYYLKKIIEFCGTNRLKLVLTKTPTLSWNYADSKAVSEIAHTYMLDFFDFNYMPLFEEAGFCFALDTTDSYHLNYFGANKLTTWFGNYLMEECDVKDIRDDEDYLFLKKLCYDYDNVVLQNVRMASINNIGDYIDKAICVKNAVVFIAIKDDGAGALTNETRQLFKEIGLSKLSNLSSRGSYIAVVDNGNIIIEESENDYSSGMDSNTLEHNNDLDNTVLEKDELFVEKTDQQKPMYLSVEGDIDSTTHYRLKSGGYSHGNIASCVINKTEYMLNQRGINVVIYNSELKRVIDSDVFDTSSTESRSTIADYEECHATSMEGYDSNYEPIIAYNRRLKNHVLVQSILKEYEDKDLIKLLDLFRTEEEYLVIVSIMEDGGASLSEESRIWFKRNGYEKLSQLGLENSFVAIYEGDKVIFEEMNTSNTRSDYGCFGITVESGGGDYKDSSIMINGCEYSPQNRGINIVLYDYVLQDVIYSKAFDTSSVCPIVPN